MNAELRRNVWLELRPVPCGVTLAVLLLAMLPALRPRGAGWEVDLHWVMGTGLAAFLFYTVWGVRKAGAAVTEEVRDRTWDQQRLSAHDGWSLLLGKLFGATAFTWFGAAGGLLLYAGTQLRLMEAGPALLHLATLVTGALACQALALLGSVLAASRLRTTRRARAGWVQTMGLMFGLWVGFGVLAAAIKELHLMEAGWCGVQVAWWLPLPLEAFVPLTLAAVGGWALGAGARSMRVELQLPVAPWGWLGFLAFTAGWLLPFASGWLPPTTGPVLLLGSVAGVGTYMTAVGERLDAVRLRTLAATWRAGEGSALLRSLPLWVFSLGVVAACAAGLAVGAALGLAVPGFADLGQGALTAATLALFLGRDAALILAAQLATPRWRGPEGIVAVGALVLYVLVPLIISNMGKPVALATVLVVPEGVTGTGSWVGLLAALPGLLGAVAVCRLVGLRALQEPGAKAPAG